VVSHSSNSTTVTATCATGKIAVGGGGSSASKDLQQSFPSSSAGAPVAAGTASSWTVIFDAATGSNTAYVVCAS
jgi:hypothetical protein